MYYAIDILMGHEIWIDQYPEIDIDKTLENMMMFFIEKISKKQLWKKGIVLKDYKYSIPKYYNYDHSTVLINIEIVNKKLFRKYMYKNKNKIEKLLKQNKSYDGYIALTPLSFKGSLNEFQMYGYPDIISLSVVLGLKISDDEYYERVIEYMDGDNDE